jgi:hypothetical protein
MRYELGRGGGGELVKLMRWRGGERFTFFKMFCLVIKSVFFYCLEHCWGSEAGSGSISRIRIRLRILPFSHKDVERTGFSKKLNF